MRFAVITNPNLIAPKDQIRWSWWIFVWTRYDDTGYLMTIDGNIYRKLILGLWWRSKRYPKGKWCISATKSFYGSLWTKWGTFLPKSS